MSKRSTESIRREFDVWSCERTYVGVSVVMRLDPLPGTRVNYT